MSFQKFFRPAWILLIGVLSIPMLIFGIGDLVSSISIIRATKYYKSDVVKVEQYKTSSSSTGSPSYSMEFYHNENLRKTRIRKKARHAEPRQRDSIEGIWYNSITEKYLYRRLDETEFSLRPYFLLFIMTIVFLAPFLYAVTGVLYWIWKRKLRLTYKNGLMKIESFAERE